MKAIILLGGPGAGKGTLAGLLQGKTGCIHVSTGDMLRAAIQAGTPVGNEAKASMDKGELVSDAVILRIIDERIAEEPENSCFMFDGFPRTIEQAKGLDQLFKKYSGNLTHVFRLDVDQANLLKRLTGRRVCKSCGAVYHIQNKPPREAGVCDIDGGELYQRADDSESTILNRLEVYKKQTEPLIAYYKKQGILCDIDAKGPPEKTAALVLDVLNV
jgi:adenylate kinase